MEIVSDYMQYHTDKRPDATVFIYHDVRISWAQFEKRSFSLARYLREKNVQKGDLVAFRLPGCPAFFYLYMACSLLGAVAVGIGTKLAPPEVSRILNSAKPRLYFDGCIPDEAMEGAPMTGASSACADDALFLLYTSGTTGAPKGILLTHRNVISSVRIQAQKFCDGLTTEDVFQLQVPVNHVSGAVEWGITPIVAGCASILNDRFEAHTVLNNTERYRATMLCGVPTMWNMMLHAGLSRYDLSSVRWCMTGASPAPREILDRILQFCPRVCNPLGMTETSGFCTYTDAGADIDELADTVGRPYIPCKIAAKKGEVGALKWAGDTVSPGCLLGADGYYESSDLGYEDNSGRLHLMGRADEVFFTGGFNVYPIEVEQALSMHPGVQLAAVLPVPNRLMGSIGRAYIVPKANAELKKGELRSYLSDRLASYKVPRQYAVVERIPTTALGKPKKAELAKMIWEETNHDHRGKL